MEKYSVKMEDPNIDYIIQANSFEEAVKWVDSGLKYHFVKIGEDGVPELYFDHHSLSTLRMCEARFDVEIVNNWRPKHKLWFLDFGTLFHSAIEDYYKRMMNVRSIADKLAGANNGLEKATDFIYYNEKTLNVDDWIHAQVKAWDTYEMDARWIDNKSYKALGGKSGWIALLFGYHAYYLGNERITPIALEVSFGKNKEVPILEDHTLYPWAPFRAYLTGRIDLLMDDGVRIGPLDHKTMGFFRNNPVNSYEIQEGMTGYVFAVKEILKRSFPNLNRVTDCIWMNFVSVAPTKDIKDRFKRVPMYKNEWELEQYRIRQISSFAKAYQLLIQQRPPDFNASVCTNYWHNDCPFKQVHRQKSEADSLVILKSEFSNEVIWDAENPPKDMADKEN